MTPPDRDLRTGRRVCLPAVMSSATLLATAGTAVGAQARPVHRPVRAEPTIAEFTVPTPHAHPFHIVTGSDGNLWFTERDANKIARINPVNGVVTEFRVPTPGAPPQGIVNGPDGNVWFAEEPGNRVGRLNLTPAARRRVGPIHTAQSRERGGAEQPTADQPRRSRA